MPASPGTRSRPTLAEPRGAAFEDEVVDPGWAGDQAREVTRLVRAAIAGARLTGVVRAGEVECRSLHCRFVLETVEPDRLGDAIALLEDDSGLRADAEQMHLSNLTSTQVTVTLRYRPLPAAPEEPVPDPEPEED